MYGSRRQKQEHKPHPWHKKKPKDRIKKGTIDLQCTIAAEYGSACPSPLSLKTEPESVSDLSSVNIQASHLGRSRFRLPVFRVSGAAASELPRKAERWPLSAERSCPQNFKYLD
jgi:hypothetical protein